MISVWIPVAKIIKDFFLTFVFSHPYSLHTVTNCTVYIDDLYQL